MLVEAAEARRRAGHLRLAAGQLLEALGLVDEDLGDRAEVAGLLGAGDVEEQLLGLLDQLLRLALARVDRLLDPLRGAEQAPQHRVLLDDLRVVAGVAGDRRARGERRDGLAAADLLELVLAAQELGDGQRVDRLGAVVELVDRARRSSRGGRGRSPRAASRTSTTTGSIAASRDHHRAQDRLLRLQVVRLEQRRSRARPLMCASIVASGPRCERLFPHVRARAGRFRPLRVLALE